MEEGSRALLRPPGEGKAVTTMGVTLLFRAVSEDTNGRYAFYEYTAPAGFGGPPPHTHPGFDEAWYVVDGELTFQLSELSVLGEAGAFVHVPGATVHSFANRTSRPAKFLGLIIPGGFERYFDELPALVAQHGYPPPPEVMQQLSEKYGIFPVPTSQSGH